MSSPKANWNRMIMLTAWEAHKQIASLTNHKEHCLIIDDSVLEHSGAKRMDNVTRTYDHNLGSTVKIYMSAVRMDRWSQLLYH